ncbi:hypothetical protein AVEN_82261-1 [Araneus ventricosus]|uniref:Uncharacterized protein n=1 Tax=Araneus ventricosus TaxID=182803 RepID=A0A4Y2HDQ6_ARAVE|nr:hypothetical protein AVEN_82261-1 [Araneus ventricosus]
MVSYLKIEIFAYDLFHTVWLKGGLIPRKYDATQIYKDECLSDNDYKEVCDKLFYDAVLCRRILFQRIYTEEITKEKDRYWDSVSDFYEYIHSMCYRYDCFGCLTVFERLFATCAFVLNLCFYNRENENVDIIKFGHICWATYFNAFTEEFYEQGGWNQLKNVANSYTLPLRFLQMCLNEPENAFTEVTEAIQNYNNLKQTSIIHECETVSKLWIKSHIKNMHTSSNNLVEFVAYVKCMPTEHILNELKRLCSPCALEVLQYDEECSERSVFDSDSFYIPLTPIASQESMDRTNSFSVSSDGIEEDASPASSSVEIFLECETDDSDFTNLSSLNELENITSSNYCDDISNGSLDIFKQPIEFESICVISDWEQDQYLSRSMTKMHLNHDTLELEETTISETRISSNTNDGYSVGVDQVLSTTDKILVPQEMMNNQCQMLEDSLDVVELVSNNTSVKVVSVIEGNPSHNKCFKKGEFEYVTTFPNTGLSYDNQISISEWDEKYLAKNTSTPNKIKTILDKDWANRRK